jgi:hypothetical protein
MKYFACLGNFFFTDKFYHLFLSFHSHLKYFCFQVSHAILSNFILEFKVILISFSLSLSPSYCIPDRISLLESVNGQGQDQFVESLLNQGFTEDQIR